MEHSVNDFPLRNSDSKNNTNRVETTQFSSPSDSNREATGIPSLEFVKEESEAGDGETSTNTKGKASIRWITTNN